MDVDVCGAGNSSKRKMDIAGIVEGTTEVIPLEMYDSARAKIDANLRWLFAKAYGIDHIPDDFRDPFYIDQYEQEHIKPPVVHLLLSCKLYCRVCALVLKTEQIALLQSHQSVIQAMSRKGIYVMESDDMPVTEGDLTCIPIKMSAHMPMIDALMMAYTVEMMSIEKVVACVKRFSTFSASKDLPFDLEDAMVFWINKVNMKMKEITERELKVKEHLLESPSHLKVRYRREHASCRLLPFFPLLEDLMRDVCDGAALLTVVHYYCPQLMKLDDICLKEVSSIADSLYNICLLKDFANLNLNKSFYLTMEDMVYSPLVLKHNVMVFIAELFWWFETVKPDFVQPRDLIDIKDAKAVPQPKSARPTVPISNATKRSFLVSPGVAEASLSAQSSPEVCNRDFLHPEDSDPVKGGPPFSSSHPLLPLRKRQQKQREDAGLINRSNSLTQVDGPHRCSVSDWPDKRPRTVSTLYPYSTAADSDADVASEDSMSLARSISKDSLASNKAPAPPRCLNDHGLQDNFRIKDEEEKEGELVAIMIPTASSQVDVLHYSDTRAKPFLSDSKSDSFFLESLMPAMLKLAKEKSVSLNKQEESGEGPSDQGDPRRGENPVAAALRKAPTSLNQTYTPSSSFELDLSIDIPRPQVARTVEHVSREPTCGFYLHKDPEEESPCQGVEAGLEKLEEEKDEQDLDEAFTTNGSAQRSFEENDDEEEESAKLKQDMSVKEHVDKDKEEGGGSGRSSPSFSGHSQACSLDSGSVRMTSFAELKALHQPFGSNHDLRSSTSSSQRTTPDGSEFSRPLASSWRLKRDQSPSSLVDSSHNLLASELVQLHMQLDKKRHAIEHQKKKMEVLSANQRQKLGKAAFLHIVKKGGGKRDMPPYPLNSERQYAKEELNRERGSKNDLYVDILRSGDKQEVPQPGALEGQRKGAGDGGFYLDEELDLNECNHSIELLNEAIGGIQQQMMQLALQQDQLMKQNVQSPPGGALSAVHFMEPLFNKGTVPVQNPPKLTLARGSRTKPSELKLAKEQSLHSVRGAGTPVQSPGMPLSGSCLPRMEQPDSPRTPTPAKAEHLDKPSSRHRRSATYRPQVEANLRLPTSVDLVTLASPEVPFESSVLRDGELNKLDRSRKENVMSDMMSQRSRSHLIEVHLSDLKGSHEEGGGSKGDTIEGPNGEQESILGFFFKDEQKAEDELAKKRAAFLLKQQKKTEEARLRKLHLEAETEAKRDEARRKAEEDRLRKEEEKTRRELIKQAYLRRKQRELMEEQGLQGNAKTKTKQKPRPKPAFTRVESYSDTVSKFSSTASDNLSSTQSGSSLSLASAATNEADSVNSGGGGSQKDESVETFPGTSRNAKRNAERDWDNGSTASSITSVAEYTGPKLFKEPSTKSNKPIIHNAISHCCLAGKVNEPQKNSILEELEKSESNHLMILFRDGGCQFRALYSYFPDTEEIVKLTGTGPKSIGKKMIEKLYKYNSDRKQFTVIPAKTVSVSVDALTIHNHLWQAKRTTLPKKTVK